MVLYINNWHEEIDDNNLGKDIVVALNREFEANQAMMTAALKSLDSRKKAIKYNLKNNQQWINDQLQCRFS